MSGTATKLRLRAFVGAGLTALLLAAVQPASGQRAPSAEGVRVASIVPVPSLEPRATARLWRALVRSRMSGTTLAAGDCRPLRAVFYAATDWLRLATRLAANASPCAEYHISIPPLVADKTQPRPDQAWRIRALGPSFHAQAEISWNAWSAWVAAGSGTWYQAGVEARRRMAGAGYDVALGDGWALNELSSAVRRGDGAARANAREFLRGLYEADGVLPRSRGTAFMVGIGQATADLATYKAHLQNWLQDGAFWTDASSYVQDWSQESYGDVRSYAVPGASLAARRDALSDYLGNALSLARGGPDAVIAARTFLEDAYSPLANGAWEWDASFGWTAVPIAQMKDFVSAQTYALRHVAGGVPDRGGFAWAPRNAGALSASEFAAQTGELLDRLAAAVRDSVESADPGDPGSGACAPAGVNIWCVAEVAGSAFNGGWSGFRSWTPPGASFTTPALTLTAGIPSTPIAVQLQLAGVPQLAPSPIAVELTSSSPAGAFATSPSGPWTPVLGAVVGTGTSTSAGVYYSDAEPGAPTLSARAPGGVATQVALVQPAATPGGGGGGAPGDLALTGTVDAAAPVGGTVSWRLRVDDKTLQPVSGVYIDVVLPPGHAYAGGSSDRGAGCMSTGPSRLRCSLDFLNAAAPAASVILTTTVQSAGTHVLMASAGFDGSDPTPADNVLSLQQVTAAPVRAPASPAPPRGVVRLGTQREESLVGGPGDDLLRGFGGGDHLHGLAGNDRLYGGAGDDVIVGGAGTDRLVGGAGNDILVARDGRRDAIACGPGRDLVEAGRDDRIGVGCERVVRR